jgi:hypothetical protein
MKSVKKYYLVPENRYKQLIQHDSKPAETESPAKKDQEPDSTTTPDSTNTYPNQNLTEEKPSLQNTNKQIGGEDDNPQKSETVSKPKPNSQAPPPGIPVKFKKKRPISWISL